MRRKGVFRPDELARLRRKERILDRQGPARETSIPWQGLSILPMLLRCSKCGSHAGFLIETQDGRTLEVAGNLDTRRIRRDVLVTCTYCDHRWDHVPADLLEQQDVPRLVH